MGVIKKSLSKEAKLVQLKEEEKIATKRIGKIDGELRGLITKRKHLLDEKDKLAKKISNNMRLQNKIINEQ